MTANILTKTDLAARIPTLIANKTMGFLKARMNLFQTVDTDLDPSEFANYGDTITVTTRGTVTANDKTPAETVTRQKPTESSTSLVLDNHKEITIAADDVARALSKAGRGDTISPEGLKRVMGILGGYAEDSAAVLQEEVEGSLAELYSDAGDTYDAGDAVTISDLRRVRRMMVTARYPKGLPIFGNVDEYAIEDLELTDASKLGTNEPVISGSVAKLGGINLFESNVVETSGSPSVYHALIYGRNAIKLAVRSLPVDAEIWGGAKQTNVVADGIPLRVTTSYDANYLAPQFTMDLLWGVKVMRAAHLIDMYHTNS